MKKPEIKIEVVSDVVCPWCYIGKRRMERAINSLGDNYNFTISYAPFELNPLIPKEGLDQKRYMADRFGEERFSQMSDHVTEIARDEGLSFDFTKQGILPNTRDIHRIVWLAGPLGKQSSVMELFHKAYFEDGVDLSKRENLVSIASSAGLKKEQVTALLDSSKGLAEVERAEQTHLERGIRGVPYFIINNKYGVSGAQSSATFEKLFREVGEVPAEG